MAPRNYCIPTLVVLFVISAVSGQQINLTPMEQYVNEGDDIMMSCVASASLKSGRSETLQILKRQNTDNDPIIVSSGASGSDSTYRSRVESSPIPDADGHAVGYSVTINSAQPHDNGEFGCAFVVGNAIQGEPTWSKVFVKKQVESLQMFAVASDNSEEILLENGKAYELTKKRDRKLMCKATGSAPAAKISVLLGDQDITEQLFTTDAVLETIQKSTPHMDIIAYTTTAISKEPIDIEVPQSISCRATVDGVEGEQLFTITTLFKHKPVIDCQKAVAGIAQSDVSLNCIVKADPKLDRVYWVVRLATGNNISLESGPEGPYRSQTETGLTGTSISLILPQIFQNHFENQYVVYAENSEGVSEHVLLLERDPNAGRIASSGTTFVASILLLATTAILRML